MSYVIRMPILVTSHLYGEGWGEEDNRFILYQPERGVRAAKTE